MLNLVQCIDHRCHVHALIIKTDLFLLYFGHKNSVQNIKLILPIVMLANIQIFRSPVMPVYPLGLAAGPITATKVASSRTVKVEVGNTSHP